MATRISQIESQKNRNTVDCKEHANAGELEVALCLIVARHAIVGKLNMGLDGLDIRARGILTL